MTDGMGEGGVVLTEDALNRLLPMHVVLDTDGTILSAGPTLARLRPQRSLVGERLFDRFMVRRPPCVSTVDDLRAYEGRRLRFEFSDPPHTALNAHFVGVPGDRSILDLSFGIDIAGAVAEYGLDQADFSPTSLAVEMLYLIEAKTAAIAELRDLTQRLVDEKSRAERRAETDSLTGVLNRRGIEACLRSLIEDGTGFGLVHIDLDFFKTVNDTHGHAAGDKVLVRVARTLEALMRASDVIGRLGGDEFLIVAPTVTDGEVLRALAGQVVAALDRSFEVAGETLTISASAGVTTSDSHAEPDIAQMIEAADRALYQSKRAGRSRATLFDPETMRSAPQEDSPSASAALS